MGSAIFRRTSGGIWVGPGANKYLFAINDLLTLRYYLVPKRCEKYKRNQILHSIFDVVVRLRGRHCGLARRVPERLPPGAISG
jgi:hypothetical protein